MDIIFNIIVFERIFPERSGNTRGSERVFLRTCTCTWKVRVFKQPKMVEKSGGGSEVRTTPVRKKDEETAEENGREKSEKVRERVLKRMSRNCVSKVKLLKKKMKTMAANIGKEINKEVLD